jgi:hypothetical protein
MICAGRKGTAIPEKPMSQYEFRVKTRVLALWNPTGRDDDWTTEFPQARVSVRPCDRAGQEIRGYLLDFGDIGKAEGRSQIVVPEKFVIADTELCMK